jgi:uncharacterized protein involved in exopolysaccharide biosynthesis
MPQLPSALLGAASQLLPGLSGGGEVTQTPGYYVQVLQSRALMVAVLETRYAWRGDSVSLTDVLCPPDSDEDPAICLDRAWRRLRRATAISADNQTSIIRVAVEAPDRRLAADIANAYLQQLNEFNLRSSREQARQRRVFVEERRNEVAEELRAAESRLRSFLLANRQIQGAPELEFEQARLQRQVTIAQEMYLTLSRAYDTQRVEESNNVAAINIIDPAVPPVRRSYPARVSWVLMGFILSLTAAVAIALLLDWVQRSRTRESEVWAEIGRGVGERVSAVRQRLSVRG